MVPTEVARPRRSRPLQSRTRVRTDRGATVVGADAGAVVVRPARSPTWRMSRQRSRRRVSRMSRACRWMICLCAFAARWMLRRLRSCFQRHRCFRQRSSALLLDCSRQRTPRRRMSMTRRVQRPRTVLAMLRAVPRVMPLYRETAMRQAIQARAANGADEGVGAEVAVVMVVRSATTLRRQASMRHPVPRQARHSAQHQLPNKFPTRSHRLRHSQRLPLRNSRPRSRSGDRCMARQFDCCRRSSGRRQRDDPSNWCE